MKSRFWILLISVLWLSGGCMGGTARAAAGSDAGGPQAVEPGGGQGADAGETKATGTGPGDPGTDGEQGAGAAVANPESGGQTEAAGAGGERPEEPEERAHISDPLMPVNRGFFWFNDKLYFWVLKPVAKVYKKVLPEVARIGVRNFFSNVRTPVRLTNCLLQARPKDAGIEFARFAVNTTVGVGGFGDPARKRLGLKKQREDLGQTLGVYGLGPGIYIDWPLLGPSCVRDSVGYAGDHFLDPINWVLGIVPFDTGFQLFESGTATAIAGGANAYGRINDTSLSLGAYEQLKKEALDPYVALRNAYFQHREYMIENHGG